MNNTHIRAYFVVIAHPRYRIGGPEVQSWLLAREFARHNWEVILTTDNYGQPSGDIEQED